MKNLGLVWTVLINFITVIIVFAIYDSFYYDDESRLIAALIIFGYISLNTAVTTIIRSQLQLTIFQTEQNAQILKAVKGDSDDGNLEFEAKDAQEKLDASNKKYYINSVGNFIIWIVTIFTILGSI